MNFDNDDDDFVMEDKKVDVSHSDRGNFSNDPFFDVDDDDDENGGFTNFNMPDDFGGSMKIGNERGGINGFSDQNGSFREKKPVSKKESWDDERRKMKGRKKTGRIRIKRTVDGKVIQKDYRNSDFKSRQGMWSDMRKIFTDKAIGKRICELENEFDMLDIVEEGDYEYEKVNRIRVRLDQDNKIYKIVRWG